MPTAAKVGVVLDKIREDAGVPLLALARQTQIPRETLRRRLAGDPSITFDEVERVAQALGTTTEHVYALAKAVA